MEYSRSVIEIGLQICATMYNIGPGNILICLRGEGEARDRGLLTS